MIKYYQGTVFNTDAKTIVNTVNTEGVMGAGVALEYRLRYPKMFKEYKTMCENGELKVGQPYLHTMYEKNILSFPTKESWRKPSRLEYIESGLEYFVENYNPEEIQSIAFPKLGTNHGGLEWPVVKELMVYYLGALQDIQVYICLDESTEPAGMEAKMIDQLTQILTNRHATITLSEFQAELNLSDRVIESLFTQIPIKRFFSLQRAKGIGKKTYEKLFVYFYNNIWQKMDDRDDDDEHTQQISLF